MAQKTLLVLGGAGALGRGVVSRFAQASWKALSVDFAYVIALVAKHEELW